MWEDFKYFLSDLDGPMTFMLIILVLITLFVGVLVFDMFVTHPVVVGGEILGKEYSPSHTGIGITNVGGKTGTTTEYYPEKWILILKYKNNIQSVSVSPEVYYSSNNGEYIKINCRQSYILKMVRCSNSSIAK